MIIVAVDPGKTGGVTVLDTYRYRETQALPIESNSLSDIFYFLSEIRGGESHSRYLSHISYNDSTNNNNYIKSTHYGKEPRVLPSALKRIWTPAPKEQPLYPIPTDSIQEPPKDNTMEMWLEEPGQIVINSKTKGKDATGALLAGMTSSRKLGRSIGLWEGIAVGLNISIVYVPPKSWQKLFKSPTRGDKNISKNLAIRLFPFLTKDNGKSMITHGVADSLVIAAYAYLHYTERKYTIRNVVAQCDISVLNEIQNHTPKYGKKNYRHFYSRQNTVPKSQRTNHESARIERTSSKPKKKPPKRRQPRLRLPPNPSTP